VTYHHRADSERFTAIAARKKELESILAAVIDQTGGGVMSVQSENGGIFDSIVFAERRKNEWLAGSNGFVRTLDFNGPAETDAAAVPVHLILSYAADGTIRAYHNGEPWGEAVRKADLQPYPAGKGEVLFGLRHGTKAGTTRPCAAASSKDDSTTAPSPPRKPAPRFSEGPSPSPARTSMPPSARPSSPNGDGSRRNSKPLPMRPKRSPGPVPISITAGRLAVHRHLARQIPRDAREKVTVKKAGECLPCWSEI
jgi:hypothetical protein